MNHIPGHVPHPFKLGGMKVGDWFMGCPTCGTQYPPNAAGATKCHCGARMLLYDIKSYNAEEVATHARIGNMAPARRVKAFTIVEIIIVITIAGLLACMAVPAFTKARERAIESDRQTANPDPDYQLFLLWRKMEFNRNVNGSTITFDEWKKLRAAGLAVQYVEPAPAVEKYRK